MRLSRFKALHQQMQHQHAGDFIGMHPGLQVHLRSTFGTLEAPDSDLHRIAIVVANAERNILRHPFVLLSLIRDTRPAAIGFDLVRFGIKGLRHGTFGADDVLRRVPTENHRQGAADRDQPGADHQRHIHQRAPDQARQQERPDQPGVFKWRQQGGSGPLKTGEQ
ncbi:hypothetical protein D3C84_922080 [compost metagenome]